MSGSVLIVDDEVPLVRFIERLLEREGFQTLGVHDGASALLCLNKFFPDVVLVATGRRG